MLVELDVVEQRYQAVLEVLGGATVSDGSPFWGGPSDGAWLAASLRL